MDDVDIRLECVRLAIQHRVSIPVIDTSKTTAELANDIYRFVTNKMDGSSNA